MLAILVEVVPATNVDPRRWRASVEGEDPNGRRRSVVVDDPIDSRDPELAAAIALLQKLDWGVNLPLHKGHLSNRASVFVFENPQEIA